MTLKIWILSIFVLSAIISICFAEEPDNDLVREKRFPHHKLHVPHHGHHVPHHGHHVPHHGHHIPHHGHSIHHKVGKHKLHKRSPLQPEDEILEERLGFDNAEPAPVDIEDTQNDATINDEDDDKVHPESGPFIDVWSKKQKTKIFHGDSREANLEKRHFHHHHKDDESAGHHHFSSSSSHHFHETEHHHHHHQPSHHNPGLPNPHANEPFHFEPSHFGHGPEMHHHSPIQKPSHGLNFESSHALKGLHGDGILIQKHLKINKFRSAGDDNDNDAEDVGENQEFDHVDGIGVFGRKP